MAKILLVTAGRGGTGKTTLALNIASGLKKLGNRVVLVDTEAHIPALGYDTNFFANPYTLVDIVNRKIEFDLALREFSGIKYLIGSWNPMDFKKTPSEKILEIVDDLSSNSDYIIFDSPLTKETINLLDTTREVVFVTKPFIEEIDELQKLDNIMDGKRTGFLINMAGRVRHELSPKAIEFLTQTPVVGQVPYDNHVLLALSVRKPVVEFNPNCLASRRIIEFTSNYVKGKLRLSRRGIERGEPSVRLSIPNSKLKNLSEKISSLENKITTIEKLLKEENELVVIE
ncbi:MAG: AAA family ATPase [Candidatus Aenigmarchaeota archaeon]|nr:AAA family ATPase [Candidatus Aenigmarchaeota archaeon]